MNTRRLIVLFKKKKWPAVFVVVIAGLLKAAPDWLEKANTRLPVQQPTAPTNKNAHWKDGQMVLASGTVLKILATDEKGSRHQRWLMRIPYRKKTVLVAHNIDIAPVVPLKVGDQLQIYGQFEANSKGGLLHWTHHDPQGRHPDGWIRHLGKTYR